MTREVFLHIGMHKTASSSIQAVFSEHADENVRYAKLGPRNHSKPIFTVFSENPGDHGSFKATGITSTDLHHKKAIWKKKLNAELARPERRLIISGEDIWRLDKQELAVMLRTFEDHDRQVRVHAYVREPHAFAVSQFQQLVKGGLARFTIPRPRYRSRFEGFINVFGSANVDLVPFVRSAFDGGDVISDFAARVGVAKPDGIHRVANNSLSREAVAALFVWNASGMKSNGSQRHVAARKRLIEILRAEFPGRFALGRNLADVAGSEADLDFIGQFLSLDVLLGSAEDMSAEALTNEDDLYRIAQSIAPRLAALAGDAESGSTKLDSVRLLNRMYKAELDGLRDY